mgnify:FL=1
MAKQPYIQSPLNYIRGKYKILPQILPLFPSRIRTFVDLFCGGCNVGINVSADRTIFNDNISYLIDLYRKFNDTPVQETMDYIEQRISEFQLSLTNENGYRELRRIYNEQKNPLDLFVLTAYSFNHQIRFNNSHEFNIPFGRERSHFNSTMKSNLYTFLDRLHTKDFIFSCTDFDKFDFSELSENDFVYCDPPYLITTGTYNDGKRGFTGWNEKQECKLLKILDMLHERGISFALSNVLIHRGRRNTTLLEWIEHRGYTITYLNKNYANSNYQIIDRESKSEEVLITNYHHEIQQGVLFE